MASGTTEYEDVELSMFEHSKQVSSQCDIDLTCYETFYDSPYSEGENVNDKNLSSKGDLHCLNVFKGNGTVNECYLRVPDVDCVCLNTDGGLCEVLYLYNSLRAELFGDFSPEDTTTYLPHEINSLPGEQQVPTVGDNIGINNEVDGGLVSPSKSTPDQDRSEAERDDERSASTQLSPANSTGSDSQDDARVPSSCIGLPSTSLSIHYIEE